jgi:endoglucanase
MDRESQQFLKKLLMQNSPSGYEKHAQNVWLGRTEKFADKVYKDVHGNAIAVKNPKAPLRVMICGHIDEIGFIITNISEDGYLHFAPIGGVDANILPGSRLDIMGQKGVVDGIIGKKAIHLLKEDERKRGVEITDLWIDIGAKNRKDAEKVVAPGDAAAFHQTYLKLRNGLISSKAFDDKAGAFVISETLRMLNRKKINVGVYAVSTVQEEIGLRGSRTSCYGIDPAVGIAVDVGFASDMPGVEKKKVGDVSLGKGPILHRGANINPVLADLLQKTAKAKKIPTQFSAAPGATGTDANAMQVSRAGVATALISVPNRYMHTQVEVCSEKDLELSAKLLSETIAAMPAKMSFIP